MAVARNTSRPRYYLLLVVLTAVTLIAVSGGTNLGFVDSIRSVARDAFAPIGDAANTIVRPFTNAFSGVFNYGDVKSDNDRLRSQLQELQADRLQADQLRRDLSALGELNKLSFAHDVPAVTARVVSLSSSNFESGIEINRGTNDGVAKGMPVVIGQGLVGRIAEVSKTRSIVSLVTDSSMAVGIRIARISEVGVVTGEGASRAMRADLIAPDADVRVGDAVVTSGLQGSIYPPDLPVGKIVRAPKPKPGALQRDVEVAPFIDLNQLMYVKVLQWSPNAK